jgi:hypothetical protein
MTDRPYLSQAEIDEITEPLQRPADQCRWLREAGFVVKQRPNGRPLVSRSNFEAVMSGAVHAPTTARPAAAQEPDTAALAAALPRKGVPYGHGKKAQRQPAGAA